MPLFTAESVYGAPPQVPSYGIATPTQALATDNITSGWRGLIDPRNPLFWAGAILLVTVGAAGAAGSVRLGKARVSVAAGA